MLTTGYVNKARKTGFSIAGEPVIQKRYISDTENKTKIAVEEVSENTKKIVNKTTSSGFEAITDGREYSEYYK